MSVHSPSGQAPRKNPTSHRPLDDLESRATEPLPSRPRCSRPDLAAPDPTSPLPSRPRCSRPDLASGEAMTSSVTGRRTHEASSAMNFPLDDLESRATEPLPPRPCVERSSDFLGYLPLSSCRRVTEEVVAPTGTGSNAGNLSHESFSG
jgi:hypothetical protein